jgi:hypothetical protein
VFSIVQLEHCLDLVIQKSFKGVLIFFRVKSIIEYSKRFVGPELNKVFFAFKLVSVGPVKSLEDFGDISHVEYVVTLGWCWQEVFLNQIEKVNGCNS